MKMRNVLRAAVEGVVKSVEAATGAVVAADQPIVRFE
jgi:biotin carboxyl carrier protein